MTSQKANENWYNRLHQMFPDLKFTLNTIIVNGFPWNTVVSVEWEDRFTGSDKQRYANQGVHIIYVKWGKIISFHIYTDTQK